MRPQLRPLPWLAVGAAAAAGALLSSPARYARLRRRLGIEGPPAVAEPTAPELPESPAVDVVPPPLAPAESAETAAVRAQIDQVRARLHARAGRAPEGPPPA